MPLYKLIILGIVASSQNLWAQTEFMAQIVDSVSGMPLTKAVVEDNFGNHSLSSQNGTFSLITPDSIVSISCPGYQTRYIPVNYKDSIILLTPGPEYQLDLEIQSSAVPEAHKFRIRKMKLEMDFALPAAQLMNRVPGIYMQSGALNTNRLTLRGMGNRSPFSTTRINAYIDDIPVTNGTGETTIEDLDLSIFETIEVTNGPYSSEFGAGLGGLIRLITPDLRGNNKVYRLKSAIGSYGYKQLNNQLKIQKPDGAVFLSQQWISSDGYRENNDYSKWLFTGLIKKYFDQHELSLFVNHIILDAQIPGALNLHDFLLSPEIAAPNWQAAMGYESYNRSRAGLNFKSRLEGLRQFKLTAFATRFDSYEFRPFNIQDIVESFWGTRIQWSGIPAADILQFKMGFEYFRDHYKLATYAISENTQDSLIEKITEPRQRLSFFTGMILNLHPWKLEAGLNLQKIRYERQLEKLDHKSTSTFPLSINPALMLSYSLFPGSRAFISLAGGLSQPTLEESLLPDGRINPEIKTEHGWTGELGYRYIPESGAIHFQIKYYRTVITDMLVSRRTAEDTFFSLNAGSAIMQGAEIFWQHRLPLAKALTFRYNLTVHLTDHYFRDFVSDNRDYSGNDLTGSPGYQVHSLFELNFKNWRIHSELRFVDDYPVNDANTVYNKNYMVWDGRAGYTFNAGTGNKMDLALAVNNILNVSYASMTSVNAVGFGNSPPRYYYPGLPVNFLLSFILNFNS